MAGTPEDPATRYTTSWPDAKDFMIRGRKTIAEMAVYCASCHYAIETDPEEDEEEEVDGVVNSCGHIFHRTCLSQAFWQARSTCNMCGQRNYYDGCRCMIPHQPLPSDRIAALLLPLTRLEGGTVLPKCQYHLVQDALKRLCNLAWANLGLHSHVPPPPADLMVATDGSQMVVWSPTYICYGFGTFENVHADELRDMRRECRQEFNDLDAEMRRSWGDYGRLQWAPTFRVGVIVYSNRCYTCQNCLLPQCRNTKDTREWEWTGRS